MGSLFFVILFKKFASLMNALLITFSTQLKRSGASTEYIQEALGHMDKKTTENYLNSFEKEVKKEFAAKLSAFKSKSVLKVI